MTSSLQNLQNEGVEYLDQDTVIIYLDCPGSQVVLLQAYFDIYEGLGVVRTLDIRQSLVCILTTPTMLNDCLDALRAIQPQTGWSYAPVPSEETRDKYLGYGKKGI